MDKRNLYLTFLTGGIFVFGGVMQLLLQLTNLFNHPDHFYDAAYMFVISLQILTSLGCICFGGVILNQILPEKY